MKSFQLRSTSVWYKALKYLDVIDKVDTFCDVVSKVINKLVSGFAAIGMGVFALYPFVDAGIWLYVMYEQQKFISIDAISAIMLIAYVLGALLILCAYLADKAMTKISMPYCNSIIDNDSYVPKHELKLSRFQRQKKKLCRPIAINRDGWFYKVASSFQFISYNDNKNTICSIAFGVIGMILVSLALLMIFLCLVVPVGMFIGFLAAWIALGTLPYETIMYFIWSLEISLIAIVFFSYVKEYADKDSFLHKMYITVKEKTCIKIEVVE